MGFHQAWISLDIARQALDRIEEVIQRQRAMPAQVSPQQLQVASHDGMIHAQACALASAYTNGLLAGTVRGDQPAMLKHGLRLAEDP
jgi:hypothetical protein